MSREKRERRYDRYGPFLLMAEVDRWCMVRRPHCTPCVKHRDEWDALSSTPVETEQTR